MYALLLAVLLSSFQLDTPQIEADETSLVGDVARASGNVVATWPGFRLETESLEWNRATNLLTVPGPATLTRGEERLTGSRLEMRTDTLEGTIYEVEGFIGPGLRVVAEEAERLADGRYIVRRGTLILCDDDGEPVLEHLVLSETEVNPGVSLTSSGNVLRFRGIPIAYLPYFRMSLEDEARSSGFLFPQTSTSTTKGRSVSLSWHQVLGRSADMTLRAEYFTRRGMGGGVQFRAVPSTGSRIEVNNFFVNDRLGQGGQRTQIAASTDGERLRTVADLNIFSSFEFRQVFEENFNVISSPTERSVAFGTYNAGGVTYNAAYHRQGTFFRDQQTTITRRFPGLDMLVHTRPLGSTGLYLSLEAGVAAVHRRDAVVSSAPLVGKIDLAPRLEIPVLRGAGLGWSHSVGLRETLYTHRAAPGASGPDLLNRLVFDYGFELTGPTFERPFGRWTHAIGPEIAYRYRTGIDDFSDTLRVDEADLLTNTHEVRYGITNRLFGEGGEVLSWSLAQKYFLDPDFGGALEAGRDNVFDPFLDLTGFGFADRSRRFSPVVSVLRFAPDPNRAADLQVDYDTTRREFRSTGLIGRYRAGLTYYNAAYFRTSETPIQIASDQVRATVGYGDTERIGFNGSLNFSYNVDESILQTTTARLSYNTECYGLHLEFSQFDVGSRKESRFRFAFSLTGLGSIGTLRRSDQFF